MVTSYREREGFAGGFDLWVAGTVKPLTHQGFSQMGCAVTENIEETIGMFD